MLLSVICPIYNEEKYIGGCIEAILRQDYPKEDLEVLLIDGGSKDRTKEIIEEYIKDYPFIKLLDNPHKIAPWAMNIGIKASQGDIIIRLDAHASYPPNYFSSLTKRLKELNADNVGTVCETSVRTKNAKSLAIREVLSNKIGVGDSAFRTGISDVTEVDTVPFGCWNRSAFDKYGLFDTRLVRNQDFEFNHRIRAAGGKIFLVPDSYCTYYARENFSSLAKQAYNNGKWNIFTTWYVGTIKTLALRHAIPMLFVLSLIIPLLAMIIWLPFGLISALSLSAYFCLIGVVSLKLSKEKNLSFVRLVQSFFVLHFSYGCGSIVGFLSLPFKKK